MRKFGSLLVGLTAVATLVGGLLVASSGTALADYGKGAQYQVELSANIGGPQGGGVWLWIQLNADGTGDYTGSDCGHGLGAFADAGDVNWSSNNGWITITGVVLKGLDGYQTTITVPSAYGHDSGTDETFLTLPSFIPSGIGNSQVQVAP